MGLSPPNGNSLMKSAQRSTRPQRFAQAPKEEMNHPFAGSWENQRWRGPVREPWG